MMKSARRSGVLEEPYLRPRYSGLDRAMSVSIMAQIKCDGKAFFEVGIEWLSTVDADAEVVEGYRRNPCPSICDFQSDEYLHTALRLWVR